MYRNEDGFSEAIKKATSQENRDRIQTPLESYLPCLQFWERVNSSITVSNTQRQSERALRLPKPISKDTIQSGISNLDNDAQEVYG